MSHNNFERLCEDLVDLGTTEWIAMILGTQFPL